jgi:hypothetical protein
MHIGDTFVLSVGVEGMESGLLKAGELNGADHQDKMAACGLASARPGIVIVGSHTLKFSFWHHRSFPF